MKKLYTLAFLRRESEILLGYKKRGFGKGKWNGFGGKVDPGETIEHAAIRELLEESNLQVQLENLSKIGILTFEFVDMPQLVMEVHVFTAMNFEGELRESDEMRPKWFGLGNIPFTEMWPDDKFWFPVFLNGKKFIGKYVFRGEETILSQNLVEVDTLPMDNCVITKA